MGLLATSTGWSQICLQETPEAAQLLFYATALCVRTQSWRDPAALLPSGIPSHFLKHISYQVASNPLPLSEWLEYAQATWHPSSLCPECSPCSDGPLTSVFCGLHSLLKSKSATLLTNNVCKHRKPSLLLIHFMLLVLSKEIVCMCGCMCVHARENACPSSGILHGTYKTLKLSIFVTLKSR